MILYTVQAASTCATQISIYLPDADLSIFSLRRYLQLCNDMCFITDGAAALSYQFETYGAGRQHYLLAVVLAFLLSMVLTS